LSPEEASAAEAAGIDLIITGTNQLKEIRDAAPNTFFTCGVKYTDHESKESIVKKCFELVELSVGVHSKTDNPTLIDLP